MSDKDLDPSNPLKDLIFRLSRIANPDSKNPVMVHINQGFGKFVQGEVTGVSVEDDAIWIEAYDVHEA